MDEEYVGVIKIFAGTYAPQGYLFCQGQTLQIMQYQALFSLIGIQYGGDGRSTFMLPNLCGRVPLGTGVSPVSGHNYQQSESGGVEAVTLNINQMPIHNHPASVQSGSASFAVTVNAGTAGTTTNDPTGAYWGKSPGTGAQQSQDYTNQKNVTMATDAVQVNGNITGLNVAVGNSGGNQPHENRQPFLALNYIICVNGIYPPRP
ncbi:phage tail protein [Pelobium manganitolerans]|uniref:phage tail protein n=1 Tax=Pelobium manganitolerans TaxID=1842495 RepID=UPI003FA38FE0